MGVALCAPTGDIRVLRLITFPELGAFWPLAERSDFPGAAMLRLCGLAEHATRLVAKIASELAARRAVQTLASLDDRMLRDIGIERGQIPHANRHGREALARASKLGADLSRAGRNVEQSLPLTPALSP